MNYFSRVTHTGLILAVAMAAFWTEAIQESNGAV